jgi:general secretion pathway protein G
LEALVVLAIVLAMLFYAVRPRIGDGHLSRIVAAQSDIRAGIKTALDHYKIDTGYFPKNLNDMIQQPSGTTNWHASYFNPPEVPIDPWGNNYIYEFPGKHNPSSYDLMSVGPDGKEGTSDDIRNW